MRWLVSSCLPTSFASAIPQLAPDGRFRVRRSLQIESVQNIGEMDVYDIQTESGEYLSDGIRVHNCFILGVEDSMASILNWYVEEGTIFKGGSGAGVNLSSIRCSGSCSPVAERRPVR